MNKINITMVLCICSIFVMSANTYRLLPPKRGDFAPDKLTGSPIESRSMNENREELSFHWLLNPKEAINLYQRPQRTTSSRYSMEIDSTEIPNGITIDTTAPGAIIRLFAVHGPDEELDLDSSYALLPENMILVNRNEEAFQGEEAFISFVSVEEMDEAGFSLPEGTVGFQINPKLEAGTFTLHIDQYQSEFPLRVHVFEKDSAYLLNLQMNSDIAFEGSQITVYGDLSPSSNMADDASSTMRTEQFEAQIHSPSGAIYPMETSRTEYGRLMATATLPEKGSISEGLWEVKVKAVLSDSEYKIIREGETAFSFVQPTARFTGRVEISGMKVESNIRDDRSSKGISVAFEVDTAHPGRYEVKGLLFGSSRDGKMYPLAMFDTAVYLEEKGLIEVVLAQETLKKSGLSAPYKIMGLTLKDQSRLAILSFQREALTL